MPKQKITKKMILDAAFTLLRTQGYESLNARNIASQTGCSVQPIYSCYSNMSELMEELFLYTQQYLTTYIEKNADKNYYFASIGRCHIGFAREEKYFFCSYPNTCMLTAWKISTDNVQGRMLQRIS